MRGRHAAIERLQVRAGRREVKMPQGPVEVHQLQAANHLLRQVIHGPVRVLINDDFHDGTESVAHHAPCLRLTAVVDRHDASHVGQASGGHGATGVELKKRVFHLKLGPPAIPWFGLSVQHHATADLKRIGHVRLVEPDQMKAAGGVRHGDFH